MSLKQSEETIAKRVKKNKGQKRKEFQKENLRNGRIKYLNKCDFLKFSIFGKYLNEHPEERERLKKGIRKGCVTSEDTKKKLSGVKKGKKHTPEQIEKIKSGMNKMSEEQKSILNFKRAYATGTHIYCIELDKKFPSLNKSVKYIKENYDILFNKHSLSKCLKGEFKHDWYGKIEINGVLTKLHWKYI